MNALLQHRGMCCVCRALDRRAELHENLSILVMLGLYAC